jgi:hypothetical protein
VLINLTLHSLTAVSLEREPEREKGVDSGASTVSTESRGWLASNSILKDVRPLTPHL